MWGVRCVHRGGMLRRSAQAQHELLQGVVLGDRSPRKSSSFYLYNYHSSSRNMYPPDANCCGRSSSSAPRRSSGSTCLLLRRSSSIWLQCCGNSWRDDCCDGNSKIRGSTTSTGIRGVCCDSNSSSKHLSTLAAYGRSSSRNSCCGTVSSSFNGSINCSGSDVSSTSSRVSSRSSTVTGRCSSSRSISHVSTNSSERRSSSSNSGTSDTGRRKNSSSVSSSSPQSSETNAPGASLVTCSVVQSREAPAPIGPYSQAVKANGLLFISGQLGLKPGTTTMPNTAEEQAAQCLQNLERVLDAAGCTCGDVVKTTVLLADASHFAAVNEVYRRFFEQQQQRRGKAHKAEEAQQAPRGRGRERIREERENDEEFAEEGQTPSSSPAAVAPYFPARSCFTVKELPKGALVEIEAVAVLPHAHD